MTVDELFSEMSEARSEYTLIVDDTWTQGRTLYGGVSAALTYKAAEHLITDGRAVRSFHCNFIGPISAGEEIKVKAEILRTGKNVTQIVAQVFQNDRVCTMSQICFGVKRSSKLDSQAADSHNMDVPKKRLFLPQIPKIVPNFIQHFDMSIDKGSLGFGKSDEAVLHGWNRFKKTPSQFGIAELILLMDAWPPTMYQLMRIPAPASTMSWDVEFIQPELSLEPKQWFASETQARHIKDGYGHEEGQFWDEKGNLLALSRQVVAIFA